MNRNKLTLLLMCFSCLTLFGQTKKGALHLFHDDMKVAYPSVVYDFLERYLYTLTNSTDGYELRQQMSDDKVKITSGDIDNIKRIHPDTPFSILRHEDAAYDICWTDDLGTPLLGLQFPIKYELLLGSPKAEIEKTIQKQLEGCSTSFNDVQIPSSLEPMPNGLLRSAPMVNYYVEELNTSAFYQKDSNHTINPVFSSEQKWYAAANMFQGVVSAITEYSLYVEQNMYGFNKQTYVVTLAQWVNYCKENNLTVYFAVEEEGEDELKALLIAQSHDLGFNHLMSVVIPSNFVEKRNAVLKAKLNAFIPTDNVKDLFQKYVNKPKKQI